MRHYQGMRDFGSGPQPINGTIVSSEANGDAMRQCWYRLVAEEWLLPFHAIMDMVNKGADEQAIRDVLMLQGYSVREIQEPTPV